MKAKAPANFQRHVADTEKRLNILFDHLNNQDLSSDTIQSVAALAENIQSRQYKPAMEVYEDLIKTVEGSQWLVSSTP